MKVKLLVIFCVFALSGCKKARVPFDDIPESKTQLKETRTLNSNGHYISTKIEYHRNVLLKKEISIDEQTGIELVQEYFYKGDLLDYSVLSNHTRTTGRINYRYDGMRLAELDYFEYDETRALVLNFTRVFEYGNGKLKKITTLSPQGEFGAYDVFSFLGDNVLAVRSYSASGEVENLTEYLYDTQFNPYYGNPDKIQTPVGLSRNNAIRVRYTDYRNTAHNSDRQFKYEYNPLNYPVKKSLITIDGNELLMTFNY